MSDSMMISQEALDLIYLVSCVVNGERPDKKRCDGMELKKVYSVALRHALSVCASLALESVVELPEYFIEAKYKAIRRLALYEKERQTLLKMFEDTGIWYLPLKGIVLKNYYPKTSMREMSDNDILVDNNMLSDGKKIMQDLGYDCVKFGKIHHDVYKKAPGLCFELHRTLFEKNNAPDIYDYYLDIKDKLIKDDKSKFGYHMTNEDFYIYIVCHLYMHYKYSGIGLRSLLDLYVFNMRFGQALDREYLVAELKKLGLLDFEHDVAELAGKTFSCCGLSESENKELLFFIDSNSHGSFENHLAKNLQNDDSANTKLKYILRRLFPSEKVLESHFPVVYRHRYLYPLLIVYRPVTVLVKKRKRIFNEVKQVKHFKKTENRGKYN